MCRKIVNTSVTSEGDPVAALRVRHVPTRGPMQFNGTTLERIASGEIDLAFRRWRRATVLPGTMLRTAVGEIAIHEIERADPDRLTAQDARRAGFATTPELLASLRSGEGRALYRVRIGFSGQDRRAALAQRDDLTPDELDDVVRALGGIDARSRRGPWTDRMLAAIEQMPGQPARDIAHALGRDTPKLKTDVRRLKEYGLTESLGTGYRLSPRGERVLAHLRGDHTTRGGSRGAR